MDWKGASKSLILSDVNTFREFVGGPIILYLMDLDWVLMIIGVMFLIHIF